MRHVRPGLWTLQIDQQRHWSAHPRTVSQPIRIRVRRVIGSP
jgi:hypothetical protein